ncbi:OLC1v1009610C2 [Oldenlandia corymbosa var. corymbosa]|nr:OLC1v1009610C2 [Oldenlandia corymbosa var. corymbosa]
MGIDPVTHKPKSDAILSGDGGGAQSKHAANLSHMAQWESARLEAEARLVRQSKLRSTSAFHSQSHLISGGSPEFSGPPSPLNKQNSVGPAGPGSQRCLDILNAWNGTIWSKMNDPGAGGGLAGDLESPTSTLSYSENNAPQMSSTNRIGESSTAFIEFVGNNNNNSSGSCEIMKEEGEEDWKGFGSRSNLPDGIENSISFTSGLQDLTMPMDTPWNREENPDDDHHHHARSGGNFVERFTDLLLSTAGGSVEQSSFSEGCGESDNNNNNNGGAITTTATGAAGPGSEYLEENKNYWDSILNLVNCSPSHTPMF